MVPDDVSLIQNDTSPVDLKEGGCGAGALLLFRFHTGTTLSLNILLQFKAIIVLVNTNT